MVFDQFDVKKDGFICCQDLKMVMGSRREEVADKVWLEIIDQVLNKEDLYNNQLFLQEI